MKMISDEDQISETDSEPPSPCSPQVEKRQYHNLLERNRRNVLKYSFWKLRTAIPSLAKKNLRMSEKKASRAKILKRAIEYINRAELKRPSRLRDIRDLQRENSYLEEQYQALQTAEETGNISTMDAIFKGIEELKQKVYEEEASETEDDDEDTDDAANLPDNDNVEPAEEQAEMNWSSDNDEENMEPQQSWSNSVTESESSDSDESSEDSSSDDSD